MFAEETDSGLEDVWYLKDIFWGLDPKTPKRPVKIITQNFNGECITYCIRLNLFAYCVPLIGVRYSFVGPCSFIAICNILILRDQIHIEPPDRTAVSYEYLSNLVAEYLLSTPAERDPSSALSILPVTRKGMDLNPLFTAVSSFRPAGKGGELELFELTGIRLVHGWLVDPESPEHDVLSRVEDYDASVNMIVSADHLTKGQLVRASEDFLGLVTDVGGDWTAEERQRVEDAIVIRDFLDRTSGQLTYHGLFHLASIGLEPGALVALFRGSHLSVLYKSADQTRPGLYTLVTDQIFAQEPSVVWERLEDVEGGASTFVDSDFVKSSPAGGDFPGRSAESVRRDYEADEIDADQALAQQLQHEEDHIAHAFQVDREREQNLEDQQLQQAASREVDMVHNNRSLGNLDTSVASLEHKAKKKKQDCIIM